MLSGVLTYVYGSSNTFLASTFSTVKYARYSQIIGDGLQVTGVTGGVTVLGRGMDLTSADANQVHVGTDGTYNKFTKLHGPVAYEYKVADIISNATTYTDYLFTRRWIATYDMTEAPGLLVFSSSKTFPDPAYTNTVVVSLTGGHIGQEVTITEQYDTSTNATVKISTAEGEPTLGKCRAFKLVKTPDDWCLVATGGV
jgi:hypothetical protein